MQLSANKTARYLIQNEYHQVELEHELLIIASTVSEERIPFNVWNGKVRIKRGLVWGTLQFFAHEEEDIQQSWLVQGLPWPQCRQFAHTAVAAYQEWHHHQCLQLSQYLPRWELELERLKRLPSFLPHSLLNAWIAQVEDDFQTMGMNLTEAHQRLPDAIEKLLPWLTEPSTCIAERNQSWLETERKNWEVLFSQVERSPLNLSQQYAVLLNDDHNLILAGAGSGKTSVLTARVAYLLQSHLAQAEELLLVAFGRDAAKEMEQRIDARIGMAAEQVRVNTFHQLGLKILNDVEDGDVVISPIALDSNLKQAWCVDWLKKHWMTPTNFKRWQKHLSNWPIAYLAGDDELGSHVENPKLIAWLEKQLDQLAMLGLGKKELQQRLIDHHDYTRLNSELSLCWPCYQAWQQMLKEQKQIDFNIMISRATEYVVKGKFKSPWKFIMIDEYQDISPQRMALIQALCDQNPQTCNLFAVGDDWQSIYQFAGSDVDLTMGFTERFPHSTVHNLDTTYRFNDQLGAVANQFIQVNPNQIRKTLNSFKQQKQKSVFIAPSSNLEKILDQLNRQASQTKSVLLLGRNHYHKPELLKDWQNHYRSLDIEFMTCHASKGKEADFVIIVGVDEGQFPARVKALHIDGALAQSSDDFPYAEERRLFYVALTRAKEKVWITHSGSGSMFVRELLSGDYPVVKQK
ncbi:DNA helicase IV [Vibrio aestuarianus]|uniref:DNA 3'-5' helicase n=1 Tax=Vibrio aestuarianus TaxID=28171 RepID=A0ABM9FJ23_9VIBR|nr:DNA helicase IV [Vibrio aestuarianus]MDE1229515.1 DNA helicase IV [Vibrio aestuarianus]MDE1252845.1 DNA helicase IV [Vibrio aestuarianus]MDE1258631.1 DNA helicase IV [Vibrio aestuarianus]MDE1270901.1 DNA helicase IV [Vibrio aestuarianus]MDE1292153.1 DNA helicase IV [Vibrio aestuarianus]